MRNINILINDDHTVSFENDYAGLNKENLQGNIIFSFKNFVQGQARVEIVIDNQDGYIELEQVGETYVLPIKSSLLTGNDILMQLVIDEPVVDEEYPIWKSETFMLKVGYSINATTEMPDDYPTWIEILDGLRTQVENATTKALNVNISSEQLSDGIKVVTTNQDGVQTTTIVPQGPQGEPGVPGAVKFLIVNTLPTEDIQTDAIYLVPSDDPTTQDLYQEYMYINNTWELLGQKQIVVDLTDYVKFTDYATTTKAGVVRLNTASYGTGIDSGNGMLQSTVRTYDQYTNGLYSNGFISKGTLENVITGKGLVSNTDWATKTTGGVIKVNSDWGYNLSDGTLYALVKNYTDYTSMSNYGIIGKGTLENVLTAKIGDIQTLLDNLDNGNGV